MLKPPPGFELVRGIGTTYSLDLNALLSIPVALVFAQTLEGDVSATRFQILEGIRRLSKTVKVYHQKGQLHIPKQFNWLFAYLEDVLSPVLPSQAYASFHPKVWILKYHNRAETKSLFRVIVLSRNLTYDRSWDVAAFLEGEVGDNPIAGNKALADFATWLNNKDPFDEAEDFIRDLKAADFRPPDGFDSHVFHPIGIDGYTSNPVFQKRGDKGVVISPFLDENAIKVIQNQIEVDKLTVFSNKEDLDSLTNSTLEKCDSYYLAEMIRDGESAFSETDDGSEPQQQNLHAKVFLFEEKNHSQLLLGSSNASLAARDRNTEFMIELIGNSDYSKLFRDLTGVDGKSGPFFHYQRHEDQDHQSKDDAITQKLRELEYRLLKAPIVGRLEKRERSDNYDLYLEINLTRVQPIGGAAISVQPLGKSNLYRRLSLGEKVKLSFKNIDVLHLSQFLQFKIEQRGKLYHQFLVHIKIKGIPKDRLSSLFKAIIDSQDKFFEYLRFLLAGEITKDDILREFQEYPEHAKNHADVDSWFHELPIYESMLEAASRNPKKLIEVDAIIDRLSKDSDMDSVIPPAFLNFWQQFKRAVPVFQEM